MKSNKIKLKKMYDVRTGGVMSRIKSLTPDDGIEYQLITLKSINSRGYLEKNSFEKIKLKTEAKEDYLTKKGDIIIRLRDPISAVYIEEDKLLVSNLFAIIRGEYKGVDKRYIAHFLNSDIARSKLHQKMAGTSIKMLRTKSIEELEIKVPNYNEQRNKSKLMNLKIEEIKLLEKLISKKEQLLKEDGKKIFK